MGPRPWKPAAELDGALDRGDLNYAITLAREVAEERRRPIDLDVALRLVGLVATRQPESYDAWAFRWLVRWISEAPEATIERAAEVACSLADARGEPLALESVRQGLESDGG